MKSVRRPVIPRCCYWWCWSPLTHVECVIPFGPVVGCWNIWFVTGPALKSIWSFLLGAEDVGLWTFSHTFFVPVSCIVFPSLPTVVIFVETWFQYHAYLNQIDSWWFKTIWQVQGKIKVLRLPDCNCIIENIYLSSRYFYERKSQNLQLLLKMFRRTVGETSEGVLLPLTLAVKAFVLI